MLRYLARAAPDGVVSAARPPPDVDRWRLGTHPDVVDWLWDNVNGALPTDARYLLLGGPALVEVGSGIVLALGLGTEYALRLELADFKQALAAGLEVVHSYRSVDVTLDLAATFGPGWVFGRFDGREPGWVSAAHAASSRMVGG